MSAVPGRRTRAEGLAAKLYAERHEYLLRIACSNAPSVDDAEEALQDTFLILIEKGDPDEMVEPLAWFTLVLKRECWARVRSPHISRSAGQERQADDFGAPGFLPEELQYEGPSPEEAALLSERVVEVREAMAKLKPQERTVLSLLALGYSYQEIQEITGWTYTKVNRCSAEGRAALRRLGLDIHKPH